MKTIKQQLKRAFTIVELVIVIAVIAALAAILIPTFVNVLNSASESNDTVLAKNLDTSLITVQNKLTKTDVTDGDGNYIYNVTEAITLVRNDGYDVSKLTPTADNADYVYNASTNRFLYYTDNFTALTYGEEPASTDTLIVIDNDLDRVDEATSTSSLLNGLTVQYCVYNIDGGTLTTDETLTIWYYSESGTSTITATNSVVYRYGEGTYDEVAVANDSYHLYGEITQLNLKQGHLELTAKAVVTDLIVEEVSSGASQKVTYISGAQVENIVDNNTTTACTYTYKSSSSDTGTNYASASDFCTEIGVTQAASVEGVTGYGTENNPYSVTTLDELSSAIRAINSGAKAYITLGATISGGITIDANKTVILNLNGYSIKNGGSSHTITNNGTLIINGSGMVDCKVEDSASAVYNNGTLTLNGGTYTRSKDDSDSGKNYYVIVNHGTATINEGVTVETDGTGASLIENGWYYSSDNEAGTNCEMTINGGTFTGGLNTIKNDAYGVMTINGGTFSNDFHTKSADGRVIMNYNVMTINGGAFSMTIDNEEGGTDAGNTALIFTSAIFESDSTDTKSDYFKGELTINDGTFTYTSNVLGGYLLYAYGAKTDNYIYSQAEVTITGGTFTANGTSSIKIIFAKGITTGDNAYNADATINISGGSFINNSTANASYTVTVASGCTLTIEDGYFESNGRYVINYDNYSTVYISGGTFIGKSTAANARAVGGSSNITLSITGGTYSSDVTEKIDADSYKVTETVIDDTTYYVVSKIS